MNKTMATGEELLTAGERKKGTEFQTVFHPKRRPWRSISQVFERKRGTVFHFNRRPWDAVLHRSFHSRRNANRVTCETRKCETRKSETHKCESRNNNRPITAKSSHTWRATQGLIRVPLYPFQPAPNFSIGIQGIRHPPITFYAPRLLTPSTPANQQAQISTKPQHCN